MKSSTGGLSTFLNAVVRGTYDAPITIADLFEFDLKSGQSIFCNNVDWDIVYLGQTYASGVPLVTGVKYKSAVGLSVDHQQITVSARPTDTINGAPFMDAIASGAFEGAKFTRTRVFYDRPPALGGTQQGGVILFSGRVATVDNVGRTAAQMTVASGLVILDYDMPRNLYSPNCIHVLYDSGCGVDRASFTVTGSVGAGSTEKLINSSVAVAGHLQGALLFTSGLNAGVTATVGALVAGTSFTLVYPVPDPVAVGDGFTVSFGCDHTRGTCQGRFANLANFRGFPFIPPPQIAY